MNGVSILSNCQTNLNHALNQYSLLQINLRMFLYPLNNQLKNHSNFNLNNIKNI